MADESNVAETDPRAASKRAAGRIAAGFVESDMVLGLGTGSTAALFLEELAARIARGELSGIRGVPTSRRTAEQAARLHIPLTTLDAAPSLDLVVDGADEVDPSLDLIKGLGGALLWEKIVAQAGARMVVIADDTKLVGRLGTKAPLPVEVTPFGVEAHLRFLRELGADPTLRLGEDGEPFVTDGAHYIVDARFPTIGIADPASVEDALRARAGVVESGLFLGMASMAVIGGADGNVTVVDRREGGTWA